MSIPEPIAAAIGAGIDITEPNGNMIVDIGGGTTDVAVISLGGIVVSRSLKVAGDELDHAVTKYIRKKYNIMIGERTAEDLKLSIGTAYKREKELTKEVRGRNLLTGLPVTVNISSEEMIEALEDPIREILDTIHTVLERTPPELSSDISNKGILLAGGGALLHGMDKLITERMGIEVNIANDPISCVARGTGQSLKWISYLDGDMVERSGERGYNR